MIPKLDDDLPVDMNRGELTAILNDLVSVCRQEASVNILTETILWIRRRLAGLGIEDPRDRKFRQLAAEMMVLDRECLIEKLK